MESFGHYAKYIKKGFVVHFAMEEKGKIQFYVIVLQILAFCIAEVSKQFARFSDLTQKGESGWSWRE